VLYEDLIYLWLGFLLFEFFPETTVLIGFFCVFFLILKELFFLVTLVWFKKRRVLPIFFNPFLFLNYTLDLWILSLKHYFLMLPFSSLLGFLWFFHYYLILRLVIFRLGKNYIKLLFGLILPIFLIIIAEGIFEALNVNIAPLEWGVFLIILFFSPIFMVKFFPFSPLKDPYWRELISGFLKNNGVSVKEIYILKDIGRKLYTAGVLGFLPGIRYLFFSSHLLEVLTPEEVLGVLGHEIGHIKRKHSLWLLILLINLPFFLLACLFVIMYVFYLIFPAEFNKVVNQDTFLQIALAVYFITASFFYVRYAFAFFLRQFEREADVFSTLLLGSVQPLITALYKIGHLSGEIYKKSWHHYGILERIEFLQGLTSPQEYLLKKGKKLRLSILLWLSINLFVVGLFSSQSLFEKLYKVISYV